MAYLRRALINVHRLLNSSAAPCRSSITSSSPIRIQSPFRLTNSVTKSKEEKVHRRSPDAEVEDRGIKRKLEQKEHKELIPLIRSRSSPCTIDCYSNNHISSQHKRKLRSLILCPVNDQLFATSALDGIINLWQVQSRGSQYGWISRYSTVSENDTIDLSNEENKRCLCNRLLYRSKQRGFLELDLVLGKWVEEHIESMDENGVKALIHVLDVENPDLWKWLTGQEQPPEALNMNPVFSAVRDKVMNNLNNHASPETRSIPGQPWVRGWDDIKKYPGNPVAGNQ